MVEEQGGLCRLLPGPVEWSKTLAWLLSPFLHVSAALKGLNISLKPLSLWSTTPLQLCLPRAQFSPSSFQTTVSHSSSLFCCCFSWELLPFSSMEESMCWITSGADTVSAIAFPTKPTQEAAICPGTLLSLLSAGTYWALLLSCLVRPLLLVGPWVSSTILPMYSAPCFLVGFKCLSEVKRKGRKLYQYKNTIVSSFSLFLGCFHKWQAYPDN